MRRKVWFFPVTCSPVLSYFSSSCLQSPASSWSLLESPCSSCAQRPGSQYGCSYLAFFFLLLGGFSLTLQTLFNPNLYPAFCALHSVCPLPSVSGALSGSTGWRTTQTSSACHTLPSPSVSSSWQCYWQWPFSTGRTMLQLLHMSENFPQRYNPVHYLKYNVIWNFYSSTNFVNPCSILEKWPNIMF